MAQPEPIEQFGKYQILERIARGGMAEIYKARMVGIGGFNRLFAIKRILPSLSENAEYVDLLVDEAKIAGLLSHANIVQILDLGQVDDQYYVAMEYVDGRDLGQVLARCRERGITLPVPHAVFILIEVLKGLEYAHKRQVTRGKQTVPLNIIHRDVSPSNVLVSFQGEVKLTDFGIAKASVKALETLSGVVKGKFDYMSPEQASAEEIDQRTDLFAAGVLLYEMLCGAHPFRRQGDLNTIEAIRQGDFQAPTVVNPDVPYALDVILQKALTRDRDQRYANATEFKAELSRFFHDAGFIFSHSTLAAFLKGLFPDSGPPRRRPQAPPPLKEQDTRPFAIPEPEDARPTQPPVPAPNLVEAPSAVFGPPALDESTLIRPGGLGGLLEQEWADVETVIRKPQDESLEELELELDQPEQRDTTVPQPPPLPRRPEPAPLPRRPEPPPRRPAPPPRERKRSKTRRRQWLMAVGIGALSFGFILGVMLGVFTTRRSVEPAATQPAQLKAQPLLRAFLPPGAELTRDGIDVPLASEGPTELTLQPEVQTVLQLTLDGYAPTQHAFTLDYNEVRVFSVTAETLQPKRRKK